MALNQCSGTFAIMNYTATIFHESGSDLSPNTSSIIVAVIQLLGTYVSIVLVDKSGRKILLIISAAGTSLGLVVLGTYSYLSKNGYDVTGFGMVPILSLSFVIFIASIGIITLPFVVIAEVLPTKIRAFGSSACMIQISLMAFTILKV